MYSETKGMIVFLLGALWAYTMVQTLNAISLIFS